MTEPEAHPETDLEWLERQRVILCSRGTPSADDLAAVRHFAEFLEQKAETERKLAAAREPFDHTDLDAVIGNIMRPADD